MTESGYSDRICTSTEYRIVCHCKNQLQALTYVERVFGLFAYVNAFLFDIFFFGGAICMQAISSYIEINLIKFKRMFVDSELYKKSYKKGWMY